MSFSTGKRFWISLAAGTALTAALAVAARGRVTPRRARRRVADRSLPAHWSFDHQFRTLSAGTALRIEVSSPAVVHWTVNQWDHVKDTRTAEAAPGVHIANLPVEKLPPGTRVQFTFYWPQVNRWEGEDFELRIEAANSELARTAGSV